MPRPTPPIDSAAPATVHRFDLRDITPQPWKNGAGTTRQIAAERVPEGQEAGEFLWRLSVADVGLDAPFSLYPGVDRCIVLLRGAGMRLHAPDGSIDHRLVEPLLPFAFRGEAAIDASLVGGPCVDFNVMTRRGACRSVVSVHREAGVAAAADATMLLCVAGFWAIGNGHGGGMSVLASLQGVLWRGRIRELDFSPLPNSSPDGPDPSLLLVRLCHDGDA